MLTSLLLCSSRERNHKLFSRSLCHIITAAKSVGPVEVKSLNHGDFPKFFQLVARFCGLAGKS